MIETDTSDRVIAGILSQLYTDGEWYPVAYYSKTMAPAECIYGIHDKEILAVVKSLEEIEQSYTEPLIASRYIQTIRHSSTS